jgi:polyisoprenoid-binding protein YceI
MTSSLRRHWLRWLLVAAAVVIVLAVAGPFAYIHFIEGKAAAPLALKSGGSSASAAADSSGGKVAGRWQVTTGSQAGYRVQEVLVGQDNTAIGRTHAVTGHLTIKGTTVTGGAFIVRMSSIHSDEGQRDVQFAGRIMDVATYPAGTFKLTKPIKLAPVPAAGVVRTYQATGSLTLHGHTRTVTFPLKAERTPAGIQTTGSIPVTFADWSIPNPSFGNFVKTQNHGQLEFLLKLGRS